ncbi:MAG: hypothetical protein V4547_18960 [Bacteroidota bacterium]
MSYQTNPIKQAEIAEILRKIAEIESNLGLDSTAHDRLVAKSKQGILLLQIKTLDSELYKILVP